MATTGELGRGAQHLLAGAARRFGTLSGGGGPLAHARSQAILGRWHARLAVTLARELFAGRRCRAPCNGMRASDARPRAFLPPCAGGRRRCRAGAHRIAVCGRFLMMRGDFRKLSLVFILIILVWGEVFRDKNVENYKKN